ncbi:MAG TPA: FCD domain-containing protein [Propionibacteriaceae bacterium]|nr:FCD domain-containing protein [Propionibacteriaceae bacterium]HPZ50737.1 FCD domain-containing protein [Propionibacteriaceae bacterium]
MAKDTSPRTLTAIKDLILNRGLRPGDPMPTENELAELTGSSRPAVREAVRTLVALDILDVRHGTGTFVGQMSLRPLVDGLVFRGVLMPGNDFEALREVVEVRTVLDMALASQVVSKLAGQDAADLRALVDDMRAAADRGAVAPEADRAFHEGLAVRLGNQLYRQLVGAFWDVHATVQPHLGLPTPQDLLDTAAAHGALVDAAVAGDLPAYEKAVHEHYAPLLRVLEKSRS